MTNGPSPYKVVIWAAVSTKAQAQHDVSLPDQVARGRAAIAAHGWHEAHPPLIVPGESRQNVISLRDAEDLIPEFRTLLDLAKAKTVNVCVTADLDRFRGLLDQVARSLALYGCQLYSIAQPDELVPPSEYRYYRSDAQPFKIALNQLQSHTEIAKLRRRWEKGMPARLERGLPFSSIPFGYRKPLGQAHDPGAVPEPVPELCAALLEAKRDYCAGVPAAEIARRWQAAGLPNPRRGTWRPNTVLQILCNPFYAGLLQRNLTQTYTDPRTSKRIVERLPADRRVIREGKHAPLWDVYEWQKIVFLREGRAKHRAGGPPTQRFSHLVYCDHCGGLLTSWKPMDYSATSDKRRRWVCRQWRKPHAVVFEDDLLDWLRAELADLSLPDVAGAAAPGADPELRLVESALADLAQERKRYNLAYGAGVYTLDQLQGLLADVGARQATLEGSRARLLDTATRRDRRRQSASRAAAFLDNFDAHLAAEPRTFNAFLKEFIERLKADRAGLTEIKLAE